MKKKLYFGLLIVLIIASLGCCVALFSITSCSGQPSQNLYTIDNIDFDFEKWYASADTIKANCNFPEIAWEDDVFNPENQEYLLEVCFNEDIYPDNISPLDLQWLFIHRYYDSCYNVSQDWYIWYTDYKGVH